MRDQKAKPLFIPLKTEYYNQFESGEKTEEYRKYGPRWNEGTCFIGRPVILSKGYGKQNRLYGRVHHFRILNSNRLPSALELYGPNIEIAAIGVELDY